ncbi:MAG: LUD domain-containing protein [Chitinophagales bacterium]
MEEKEKKKGLFDSLKKVFSAEEEAGENTASIDSESIEEKTTYTRTVDFSQEEKEDIISLNGSSVAKENDVRFAENFAEQGGKFIYCESKQRFFQLLTSLKNQHKWNHIFSWTPALVKEMDAWHFQKHKIGHFLDNSDVAISYCEFCCADEGVLMLSPEQSSNRKLVSFPPVHIIIATRQNMIDNLPAAINKFAKNHFGKFPALVEIQADKKIGRHYHKEVIDGGNTKETFVFYIDIPSFEG